MSKLSRILLISTAFALYTVCLLFLLAVANWQKAKETPIEGLLPYWKPELILFGWVYGVVVYVWGLLGLDFVDTFAVVPKKEATLHNVNSLVVYDKSVVLDHFPFLHFNSGRVSAHDPGRVFYITSVMSLVLVWAMLGYLYFTHMLSSGTYYFPSILFPLTAFVVAILFVCVPYIPPFWSTRVSLGAVIGQVLVAIVWPFWGVKFVHVIVGDLMTSAFVTLWYIEWGLCFLFSGQWLASAQILTDDVCGGDSIHAQIMTPVMFILPFWIRSVQCVYRTWETRSLGWQWVHLSHVVNLGKYLSCILVVVFSTLHTTYDDKNVPSWTLLKILWVASLIVKTLYCFAWDIFMDWDLGKFPKPEENIDRVPLLTEEQTTLQESETYASTSFPPFLRRTRYIPYTWIYYYAMASNLLMRTSWSFALSPHLQLPPAWGLVMSLVEIVRRGQWKIFRLENEFIQNQKKRQRFSVSSLYDTPTR